MYENTSGISANDNSKMPSTAEVMNLIKGGQYGDLLQRAEWFTRYIAKINYVNGEYGVLNTLDSEYHFFGCGGALNDVVSFCGNNNEYCSAKVYFTKYVTTPDGETKLKGEYKKPPKHLLQVMFLPFHRDAYCAEALVHTLSYAERGVVDKATGEVKDGGSMIHHINGDTFDNLATNLLCCNPSRHARIHAFMRKGLSAQDAIAEVYKDEPELYELLFGDYWDCGVAEDEAFKRAALAALSDVPVQDDHITVTGIDGQPCSVGLIGRSIWCIVTELFKVTGGVAAKLQGGASC